LDITPKSAQKIKPVLERWMAMAEERYKNGAQNLCDFIGLVPSKKRKRRTSFTPQALEILNEYFERSTHPTGPLLALMLVLNGIVIIVILIHYNRSFHYLYHQNQTSVFILC